VSHALIAEDDDDDFEIFSAAIDEISVAVVLSRAVNGEVLMKKLDEIDILPDILFLDILMPSVDGRECLKLIRSSKKFDTMPIVMFSSLSDIKSIDFCFREGSNLYLLKPYSLRELIDSLEKVFKIDWDKLYYPPITQFILPQKPHERE
jgi:DNA-binding response OmpR family regulator